MNVEGIYKLLRSVISPSFYVKHQLQLMHKHAANQRLYLHYIDSTIPLLPKSEISSLQPSYVAVQPSLFRTWWETQKSGFLMTRRQSTALTAIIDAATSRNVISMATTSVIIFCSRRKQRLPKVSLFQRFLEKWKSSNYQSSSWRKRII